MADKDDASDALPPPPKARGRDRELWVGLFVVTAIAAVLGLLYTLTDAALFRGRYIVKTVVENAQGIRRGDPVQMRGVNIGRIHGFRMVEQGVEVALEIEGEYDVPEDSKVLLRSSGLLGGLIAEVVPGASPRRVGNYGMLAGSAEGGLTDTAQTIAHSADVVMRRAERALSEQTVDSVRETATALAKGSREAESLLRDLRELAGEQRREIKALTESLRRSASAIEGTASRPELDRSIARLDEITQRLSDSTTAAQRATTSLEAVLSRIERGEGTLGRLTKDDVLYVNLNQATENLNRLLEDVRRNPKRYVKLSVF